MTPIHHLLSGALAMATLVIGVIFLRLWRDGGDRLFLFFALSFIVQAANRVALSLAPSPGEGGPAHYWVRLVAYLLILAAIYDKNRGSDRSPGSGHLQSGAE